MEQGRLCSRVLRMGTISYYNGDEDGIDPTSLLLAHNERVSFGFVTA